MRLWIVAVLLSSSIAFSQTVVAQANTKLAISYPYQVIKLEKQFSYDMRMNESGDIVGLSASTNRPMLWRDGRISNFGFDGTIEDFNNQGSTLLGVSSRPGIVVPVAGPIRELTLPPEYSCHLGACSKQFVPEILTQQGEVLGTLTHDENFRNVVDGVAVYRPYGPLLLNTQFPSNIFLSRVTGINSSRQCIGFAIVNGVVEGVMFKLTEGLLVKDFIRLGAGMYPQKITESGAILMNDNDYPSRRFWVLTPQGVKSEVTLSGTQWIDMNSSLTLVGQSSSWSDSSLAAVKIMQLGRAPQSLNSFLNPVDAKLVWVVGINDFGQILAHTTSSADPRCRSSTGFCSRLLTPQSATIINY
jgi:hypothetical protein